ncbi:hypothetical protein V6N12_045655 [Hibiscus sabdariffa]|uniref:Uncharacterized protein n=1 Tax=Hibiscus sabdariffa TaxID=183260 RepID=A0ABR2G3P0_9ROSI
MCFFSKRQRLRVGDRNMCFFSKRQRLRVDGSFEPVVCLARLDVASRDNLELPFIVEEVWEAIHLGNGCKALGPDGYSFEFYKRGVATLHFVLCC